MNTDQSRKYHELADIIHHTNRRNGWWKTPRSLGVFCMLFITELAEWAEADRKHAVVDPLQTNNILQSLLDIGKLDKEAYDEHIKGSLAEELADYKIRILDWLGYYGELFFTGGENTIDKFLANSVSIEEMSFEEFTEMDIGEQFMAIVGLVWKAYDGMRQDHSFKTSATFLCKSMRLVEWLARAYEIDLDAHIVLKNARNALRGERHGGRKY